MVSQQIELLERDVRSEEAPLAEELEWKSEIGQDWSVVSTRHWQITDDIVRFRNVHTRVSVAGPERRRRLHGALIAVESGLGAIVQVLEEARDQRYQCELGETQLLARAAVEEYLG